MRAVSFLLPLVALLSAACVSLQIIPSTFTQPKLGMIYEQKFQVLNANTSIGGIRIIDGALPPGLSLEEHKDQYFFLIRGTPTKKGQYHFTVEVWCKHDSSHGRRIEQRMHLTVW